MQDVQTSDVVERKRKKSGGAEAKEQAETLKSEGSGAPSKNKRHRKDKPWDTDDVDHWKVEPFRPEDFPNNLLEESSFATLFPKYREKYLRTCWDKVQGALRPHHVKAELDLVKGKMSVHTTKQTKDPYIIVKSRDFIKLLARSVPVAQAAKILQDDTHCDIIKIGGLVRNKERFNKRRQRLLGPNGSTLKALEILSGCYILIQGQTVSTMGSIKGLSTVRKVVEDCMKNLHPVYHIKELMIRRELQNDERLKEEDWSRFLPQFKKRNLQRKNKKPKKDTKKKKEKPLFPPLPTPRKEDIEMETGEYFLTAAAKERRSAQEKKDKQKEVVSEKKRKRQEEFIPPSKKVKAGKK
eukprot:GHVU01124153.1.p1 GENE.GHVU01124153.1~~GHVU01124153.1.p1  ORF type:complete len:353 (-),score=75.27 GHVU01124153.1:204-1262(-)